eukprot:3534369-Prymnesium_polylepis.1
MALRRTRGVIRIDDRKNVREPPHTVRLASHAGRDRDAHGRRPSQSTGGNGVAAGAAAGGASMAPVTT